MGNDKKGVTKKGTFDAAIPSQENVKAQTCYGMTNRVAIEDLVGGFRIGNGQKILDEDTGLTRLMPRLWPPEPREEVTANWIGSIPLIRSDTSQRSVPKSVVPHR